MRRQLKCEVKYYLGVQSPKKYKLSVVVPVGSLKRDSQTLEKWIYQNPDVEVILVLESPDQESKENLDRYIQNNSIRNITTCVVNFKNPGSSRNAGLRLASGEWVTFSDADDLPQIHNMKLAIETDLNSDTKVVIGNFEVIDLKRNIARKVQENNLNVLLRKLPFSLGLWRFIFRRDFLEIKEAQFPELSMAEDQVFLLRLNPKLNEIHLSDMIFYKYKVGANTQLTRDKNRIQDLRKAIKLSILTFGKDPESIYFDFIPAQIYALILNGARRYFISNSIFTVQALLRILKQFGFRKFIRILSYPIRRLS